MRCDVKLVYHECAEKVVILGQGKQLEQPSLEIANDQDRFTPAQIFSIDVNNLVIAATVHIASQLPETTFVIMLKLIRGTRYYLLPFV